MIRDEPTSSFGAVAPYYDELMKPVPYRMWTGYYLLLLSTQNLRPREVLDVACGTGTMCEMLTEEGLILSGFDLSPGMIDEARRKARHAGLDIEYRVADATDFEFGRTYDAAYSFFDSLNNVLEPDGLARAFRRVREHLEPGGSWIFDLNTAYAFEAKLFDQKSNRKNARLQYEWHSVWDPESMICEVEMDFRFRGEPFREIHRQRAHRHEDVLDWLEAAGFGEIRAYHAYTLNPPRYKSDRIHYAAVAV